MHIYPTGRLFIPLWSELLRQSHQKPKHVSHQIALPSQREWFFMYWPKKEERCHNCLPQSQLLQLRFHHKFSITALWRWTREHYHVLLTLLDSGSCKCKRWWEVLSRNSSNPTGMQPSSSSFCCLDPAHRFCAVTSTTPAAPFLPRLRLFCGGSATLSIPVSCRLTYVLAHTLT